MVQEIRCAHISDLHFSSDKWHYSHLLSKRWLGYFNFQLKRKKEYASPSFTSFHLTLQKHRVSHVLISGDLTSIATSAEFEEARRFVSSLKESGYQVWIIPGNHDRYIKRFQRSEDFYHFFAEDFPSHLSFSLAREGVAASVLLGKWWIVGLDTAVPTSLISSCGLFSKEREENLRSLLREIPSSDPILLMNHYPLFQNESPRKALHRGKALEALVREHPNIRFYLHGHTHRHCLADLRPSALPVILDSGSLAHKFSKSWNLLCLTEKGATVKTFFQEGEPFSFYQKHSLEVFL